MAQDQKLITLHSEPATKITGAPGNKTNLDGRFSIVRHDDSDGRMIVADHQGDEYKLLGDSFKQQEQSA